jgi:HTH-type transcriptional regulator/antitoxin HigA
MATVPAYRELLAEAAPTVIHTEAENERTIRQLERLTDKGSRITHAERKLAELLIVLIENFEEKHYTLKAATPGEVLVNLIEAHGLKQKDLADILGSTTSIVSEIIHGKRNLTVRHIQKLSERFHVSPEVFITPAR